MPSPLLDRLDSLGQSGQLALLDPEGGTPFQAVIQRARRLAAELQAGGLAGGRIGLSSTPDRNWVEGFWAILLAGGTVVPISPLHPAPERDFFLRQSAARAHLVSPSLSAVMPEGPVPRLIFDAGRLLSSLPDGRSAPPRSGADFPSALLLYTSGTTGQPKGVPLSHHNVWSTVQTLIDDWGLHATDRLIHALPLHHVHGICVALLCAFCAGASTELLPRYDAATVLDCAEHASVLMSVPTQHKRLLEYLDELQDPALRQRYQAHLQGLRLITSGSAKLPEQLGRRLQALSGQYPLERYGMTEVGIVIGNPLHGERRVGSCGRPLPGVELRIVDEQGRDLPAGRAGELWIRGPSVFAGYDRDALGTRAAFDSGYFKSGDTAQWTGDGFVEILGRSSVDIIKSGGYKLSAIQIEEQLRAHPWVQDVAVVGIPDETWGERAVAVVVPTAIGRTALDSGSDSASEQLRAWLKQRLAGYQVPRSVVWRAELPRNAMGKVQKPELIARLPRGDGALVGPDR